MDPELVELQRSFLRLPATANKLLLESPNKDFYINLLGSGLSCSVLGGDDSRRTVDKLFVSTCIIGPDREFLPGASEAAMAMMKCHSSFPRNFILCRPNPKKKKAAAAAAAALLTDIQALPRGSSASATDGNSISSGELLQPAAGGSSRGGLPQPDARSSSSSRGLPQPDAGGSSRTGPAQHRATPTAQRWPDAGASYAAAAGTYKHVEDSVTRHAEWYMTFGCSMMVHGCQAVCFIAKLCTDEDNLHVQFSHSCQHRIGCSPVAQLRGAARHNLTASAGAYLPSQLHGSASADRPPEQQITNNVSACGSSSQVIRQAMYEWRKTRATYHEQPILSVAMRATAVEAADKGATPEEDQRARMWYGDTPVFTVLHGSNFVLVRMTDLQLRTWLHFREKGCAGWFVDTTEGMVRISRDASMHARLHAQWFRAEYYCMHDNSA
jgi:hypothetical protein